MENYYNIFPLYWGFLINKSLSNPKWKSCFIVFILLLEQDEQIDHCCGSSRSHWLSHYRSTDSQRCYSRSQTKTSSTHKTPCI